MGEGEGKERGRRECLLCLHCLIWLHNPNRHRSQIQGSHSLILALQRAPSTPDVLSSPLPTMTPRTLPPRLHLPLAQPLVPRVTGSAGGRGWDKGREPCLLQQVVLAERKGTMGRGFCSSEVRVADSEPFTPPRVSPVAPTLNVIAPGEHGPSLCPRAHYQRASGSPALEFSWLWEEGGVPSSHR